MTYDTTKGYGLVLIKFHEHSDYIIYKNTKREIIELADAIIRSFNRPGLIEELNEMRSQAMYRGNNNNLEENELFKNKFEIPSYFINLILAKHNMKVVGW